MAISIGSVAKGVVSDLLGETPPVVGYRFAAVLLTGIIPQLAPVDMRFQEVGGLKLSRNIGNEQEKLLQPDKQRQILTLKRGMPQGPTPLQVVQLIEQAFWDTRLLQTNILIATLKEGPVPIPTKAWLVHEAFLQSLEWGNLNAGSNEVLIETMSYSYKRVIPVPI
ncbi:phage tail protein [Spongorhabdus nitratireducens]